MTTIHIHMTSAVVAGILLDRSALNFCTDYDHTDTGILVTARWSPTSFSSGEKELWHVLGHLSRFGEIPAVDESHLDERNRQAIADARAVLLALRGVQ